MSNHKWRKALKSKKRFDPRYFMSEREEEVATKSNSEQIEQIKKFDGSFSLNSFDSSLKYEGQEILKEMQLSSPMNSRFDNSDGGSSYNDQVSIGGMDDLPSEEESPCAAMNQTYFVKTSFGELTSKELEAAITTATNWMNIGVEILDASPEVLSAIGGLNEEQEELEESEEQGLIEEEEARFYYIAPENRSGMKAFQEEDIVDGGLQAEFGDEPDRAAKSFAQSVFSSKGYRDFSVFDVPSPDVTTWPVAIVVNGNVMAGEEMDAHIERGQQGHQEELEE